MQEHRLTRNPLVLAERQTGEQAKHTWRAKKKKSILMIRPKSILMIRPKRRPKSILMIRPKRRLNSSMEEACLLCKVLGGGKHDEVRAVHRAAVGTTRW